MPITNKAISLKRLRELKEIFKENKNILKITQPDIRHPHVFAIWAKKNIGYVELGELENKGFTHTHIAIVEYNGEQILRVEIHKRAIEANHNDIGYKKTDFLKMSQKIDSEEFWKVRYHLQLYETKKIMEASWSKDDKIRELESRISILFSHLEKKQEASK